MLLKCCIPSLPANLENSQDWKRSDFIPIWKKSNGKECSDYHAIVLITHACKEMLKILQARLEQTWAKSIQMYKLALEKAEEPEIKLPTSVIPGKKNNNKHLLLLHWLCKSLWLCGWKIGVRKCLVMMAALKGSIGKNNIASLSMTDREWKQPNIYPTEQWVSKCVISIKGNIIVSFNETEFWFWHMNNMDEPW